MTPKKEVKSNIFPGERWPTMRTNACIFYGDLGATARSDMWEGRMRKRKDAFGTMNDLLEKIHTEARYQVIIL
jgi:hypothetical protein